MNEYATVYPRTVVETSNVGSGWGPIIAAGVGGVIGYFLGRNNNGCGNNCGNNCGNPGGQTAFQQGEYAGEARAADNFIATQVNKLENMLVAMNNDAKDQRIADLTAKTQALETRQLIVETTGPISCQLGQVNRTLESVTTGCGIKSYPGRSCGYSNGF